MTYFRNISSTYKINNMALKKKNRLPLGNIHFVLRFNTPLLLAVVFVRHMFYVVHFFNVQHLEMYLYGYMLY